MTIAKNVSKWKPQQKTFLAFDVNGEEANSHGNGLNHVILVHTKNDVIFFKALYMLGLKKY